MVHFLPGIATGSEAPIPVRGREFVPRRLYIRPADYTQRGFTQGCRGCTWAQNHLGHRAPHTEACRSRMEAEIAQDDVGEGMKNVQERQEHFAAAKVAEGDINIERGQDPQPEGAK